MGAAHEGKREPFFRIGTALVKEGALKDMTAADLKVFMVLSLHANWRTGHCWPSYERIREFTGCSRSSIASALRHLAQIGQISSRYEKAHNGRRNVYTVFRTLQPTREGRSSHADSPPSVSRRDARGCFQSSRADEGWSSHTDDPQSSGADENEFHLNESKLKRSKEDAPPTLVTGGVTQSHSGNVEEVKNRSQELRALIRTIASGPPRSPRELSVGEEEILRQFRNSDGVRAALAFCTKSGRQVPSWLKENQK